MYNNNDTIIMKIILLIINIFLISSLLILYVQSLYSSIDPSNIYYTMYTISAYVIVILIEGCIFVGMVYNYISTNKKIKNDSVKMESVVCHV